jgi:hypothetical protein
VGRAPLPPVSQALVPRFQPCVGGYVFEPVSQSFSAPGGILVIVVFDSQANYTHHRDDPEQERWDQRLRDLLEQAPEWNEGEITAIFGEPRGL